MAVAVAVVAAGGAGVGVAGGVLDVDEVDAGVEGESDEGVAERVRGEPGVESDLVGQADDEVVDEPVADAAAVVGVFEQGASAAPVEVQLERSEGGWGQWVVADLAALGVSAQHRVAAFVHQVGDVACTRLRGAHPVERQESDQGAGECGVGVGVVEVAVELGAGQAERARRLIDAGALHSGGGVAGEEFLIDCPLVGAAHCGEALLDGAGSAARLAELIDPDLHVGPPSGERVDAGGITPRSPLAQRCVVGAAGVRRVLSGNVSVGDRCPRNDAARDDVGEP